MVHGPWPFGMLRDLYKCLESLATDVLNLSVESVSVVCPRCRQTTQSLEEARTAALNQLEAKGPSSVLTACTKECVTLRNEGGSGDAKQAEEVASSAEFDVSGFATWTYGLSEPAKRSHAVSVAFERAVAPSTIKNAKMQESMLDHAWSLLQTYVCISTSAHSQSLGCSQHSMRVAASHSYLRSLMEADQELTRVPAPWVPFRPPGHDKVEESNKVEASNLGDDNFAKLVPARALAVIKTMEHVDLSGTVPRSLLAVVVVVTCLTY